MSFQVPRFGRAILAAILTAASVSLAAAASRDQTPTYPNDVSPAGLRAIASQTNDPVLRRQIGNLLPENALEAVQSYVRETRNLGLEGRSGIVSITSAPTNVNANTNHAPDRVGETQSEIAVAVFGDTVVVGWNDSQGFVAGNTVTSYGYSTNGGATFTDGGNVPLAAAGDQAFGDAGIDTDERGNWYLNQIYTRTTPQQNIGVHNGRFIAGVLTWNTPVMASIGTAALGNLDKCLLACDRVTGNVYVSYTRFTANPQIEIVRSTTQGATWGPAIILDAGTTPTSSKQAARPFCGPGGEVYVVWEKGANSIFCPDGSGNIVSFNAAIGFTRSLNFGASYDPVTIIGNPVTSFLAAGPGDLRERANEFPDIAVDRSGLSTNGNLYVTWHQAADWTANTSAGPVKTELVATNNNPGTPDLFAIGDDVTGAVTPAGDLDYWQFSATQGQNLLIDVLPQGFVCGVTGTTRQMRVRLFATQSPYPNPTGFPDSLLAGSFIGSFENRIIWTAPKTGNYLIRLQISGGTTTGTYTMRLRPVTFSPNPARDDRDVVVVRSSNQGGSWTSPQLVNDDAAGLENTRPFVSVDGRGHVHVFWHDHRNAGLGNNAALTSIYGTTSRDGGVTWTPNYEVTDQPSFFSLNTLAVPNLGDYNQAASSGLVTYPAWSDQRQTGVNADVRTPGTNIFTAGRGPEAYTARVIFDLLVTGPGNINSPTNTASLTFTIKNNGTIQDTYNYIATDTQGWLTGATSGSTGVLQPGESRDVKMTVTSPPCAGLADVVTFTATPVGDADDSKSASSTVTFPAGIGPVSTSTYICPLNPCVTLPVNVSRSTNDPVLGYSVTIQLSANLTLCAGKGSITEGTFLSSVGPTTFQVVTNGGGSYTVDGAILANCGPTGNGNAFNVAVTSSDPGGTGSITVTDVKLRDCSNVPLAVTACGPGTVPIDNQAPVVTVVSPNGGESWLIGSSQKISWTATDNTAVGTIDIAYSTDGGATFPNVIATGISNSGTFVWTVPNTPTTTARVRVTAHDVACSSGRDDSDANFTIRDPLITATAGPGGSITPSGPVSVPYGTDIKFAITPADKCHAILDVKVDGVSVGAVASYTFTNVTTDHTIDATFSTLGPFTITASAGTGGTITPSGPVLVACGGTQTFAIVPDNKCSVIDDVKVDGVSVGPVATYTFTDVQTNHTIAASFSTLGPFTITATAGAGGSITPSGPVLVNCGASQTFDITPADKCQAILDVKVDGLSVGPVATYTFIDVQTNHTIDASFTTIGPFTITATAGTGGTISPSGAVSVNCGDDQTFSISAAACYTIADVKVDNVSVGPVATYTFTDVQTNHTIDASFVVRTFTLTVNIVGGGTVNASPPGPTYDCGTSVTLTAVPNPGYSFIGWSGDFSGNTNPLKIVMGSDHTVTATFADITCPSVHVDMPNGGEIIFIGQVVKLAWTATDGVGVTSVDLYISRDNGATQEKIASGIANTGTFNWTVTGPGTNTDPSPVYSALLTVFASDAAGNTCSDVSDNPWAIFDLVTATVLAKFEANPIANGVELRWRLTGDLVTSVSVERADQEIGPWSTVNAELRTEGDESVLIDRNVVEGHSYYYRLAARSAQGQVATFGPLVGSAGQSIKELGIASVTPNPSFGPVRIEYTVPKEVSVDLSVLDLQGRVLAVLSNGTQRAGRYQTVWNGQTSRGEAPAGIYFLRLQAAGKHVVRRIVLGR